MSMDAVIALVETRTVGIKSGVVTVLSLLLLLGSSLLAQDPDLKEDQGNGGTTTAEQSPAAAETRSEQLKQRREEKRENLTPPTPHIAQKYLKRFDAKGSQSVDDTNFWGFYPRIDWIARGSGAALGVRYWKPEIVGPVDLMGSAFYSWRRYGLYDFQTGLIPNRGKRIPSKSFEHESFEQLGEIDRELFSRFKLFGNLRYRDRTDDSFYGVGPDSKAESRLRYSIQDTLAEVVTGYQFTERIGFTYKAGYLGHTLGPGRSDPSLSDLISDDTDLPEYTQGPNYFRLQGSFLFDYRDDPGVPHKGFMAAFLWQRMDNIDSIDRFNFTQWGLDGRAYIPLGSRQRVLAFRGLFIDSDPASRNVVPFFLMPSLGGGESLRGYDAFRFQGPKIMLVQAEYRWEASRRFELALFGDTGTVARIGSRISLDKLKSDWGIGLRIKSSRSTLFRIDQAFSNEGPTTQFRFSAVF
ncbi:MAG TPA: BamA/TamA family outer membrane protein [Acidobacteriota bacterium]|nr:BamA/TamA family outer membrane protein [Acidobacteriota bacterium]